MLEELSPDKKMYYYTAFKSLERDLRDLSYYVDIKEAHYNVDSIEIRKIVFSACALIETAGKSLCKKEKGENQSIAEMIYEELKENEFDLSRVGIFINNKKFIPWNEGKLSWWTAYNKCKHEPNLLEDIEFFKAAIESVCALCVLVVYFTETTKTDMYWQASDFLKIGKSSGNKPDLYSFPNKSTHGFFWER